MITGRAIQPSLIAGHIAVAALALASMRAAPPIDFISEWHQARQLGLLLSASPRRVSMQRRTSRSYAITLLD